MKTYHITLNLVSEADSPEEAVSMVEDSTRKHEHHFIYTVTTEGEYGIYRHVNQRISQSRRIGGI